MLFKVTTVKSLSRKAKRYSCTVYRTLRLRAHHKRSGAMNSANEKIGRIAPLRCWCAHSCVFPTDCIESNAAALRRSAPLMVCTQPWRFIWKLWIKNARKNCEMKEINIWNLTQSFKSFFFVFAEKEAFEKEALLAKILLRDISDTWWCDYSFLTNTQVSRFNMLCCFSSKKT